jgi:hypothetical protein
MSRPARRPLTPRLLSILVAIFAAPAAAQTYEGRVVAESSGNPIAQATVAVIADGRTIGGSLTDQQGAFSIRMREAGTYTIRVTAQGYSTAVVNNVSIDRDETRELADFRLRPNPIALEAIIVEADRGRLRGEDKVRLRQALGLGTFFSGRALEQIRPRSLTEYLARETDLQVHYDRWGFPYLWSPIGPHHCLVVQVNHWPLSTQGYRSLDEIRLDRIAAIEIYNTVSEVPPEPDLIKYTREPRLYPGQECGLVNVWLWRAW